MDKAKRRFGGQIDGLVTDYEEQEIEEYVPSTKQLLAPQHPGLVAPSQVCTLHIFPGPAPFGSIKLAK